jgi:general secretion pathway protein D
MAAGFLLGGFILATLNSLLAQDVAPGGVIRAADGAATAAPTVYKLKWQGVTRDMIMEEYSKVTGRIPLVAPDAPAVTITLRSSRDDLTREDWLMAVETMLAMNGIGLIRSGEKFVKVIRIGAARQESLDIREILPEPSTNGSGSADTELVSQLITLDHIDFTEANKIISHLKHPYAVVQNFDRNNTVLVTETADNIRKMVQLIRLVDVPAEIREEPHIIKIQHTKASEIKKKLDEIISEQQKQMAKPSTVARPATTGAPGFVPSVSPIQGVIRPVRPAETATSAALDVAEEQAERGIIQGTVRIIADDRTSQLILITRPENMKFFEKAIAVFDVATDPEVEIRVFRLEFASAKAIASMLNDLIGAASKDEVKGVAGGAAPGGTATEPGRGTTLRELPVLTPAVVREGKSKIGELSKESVKILSDERTNSLIIMASKNDLAALGEIIKNMDMMLSQVLVEAAIVEIKLGDEFQTGVDWIQRSLIAYNQRPDGTRKPLAAFQGRGGGGQLTPVDATGAVSFPTTGGLAYYFTIFGLNVDMVLQMVSKDNRSKVLSTPVIMTQDNTEAQITSTDQIYIYNGKKYDQHGNPYDDYTTKDVGLMLTVKPHINTNNVVMMDIKQTMSEPGLTGAPQSGGKVSSQRTLSASIAVADRQTIVLGGQVRDESSQTRTKIPFLGAIPILGRLFSSASDNIGRTETVVFITPYVLDDLGKISAETARRTKALNMEQPSKGWGGETETAEPKPGKDERRGWFRRSAKTSTARNPVPASIR